MQAPVSSCPTFCRYKCSQGVRLGGTETTVMSRAFHSAAGTSAFTVRKFRSTRTRSPVRRRASPPPIAASGDAFRIDGLADVPLCRPSPSVGSSRCRFAPARLAVTCSRPRPNRKSDGATATDYQHRMVIHRQRRIVDPRMIVLRTIEHDCTTFEDVFVTRLSGDSGGENFR